jgi:segregation and condensation protein B
MTTQRQDGAMLDEQPLASVPANLKSGRTPQASVPANSPSGRTPMNMIDMDESAGEPEINSERVSPPGRPRKKRPDASPTEAPAGELEPIEHPCADLPLESRIEALLMSADRPMTEARLASLLGVTGKGSAAAIRDAVDSLNAQYDQGGRCFRIEKLAGGYQALTRQEFAPLVSQFHREREDSRLSNAALETLAIVAYRQPILRAQIEAIRGVAAGEVLRGLLERRLVKIVGRAEELGRPMLYGTTGEFLRVFGLAGLDDLPEVDGLSREPAAKIEKHRDTSAGQTEPSAHPGAPGLEPEPEPGNSAS